MAFVISNPRHGNCGDLKIVAGDWTGLAGDDNGATSEERGRTYLASFTAQDNIGPTAGVPVVIVSRTDRTTNFGIANRKAVTTGRFLTIRA